MKTKPKKTPKLGVASRTARGFPTISFRDEYDLQCSIQTSSACPIENEDGSCDNPLGWLWLGVDDVEPRIMKSKAVAHGIKLPPGEVTGWMPYPIPEDVLLSGRMHLGEAQVRGLIERLQHWLDHNGKLTP